jgi:hypothetical protein
MHTANTVKVEGDKLTFVADKDAFKYPFAPIQPFLAVGGNSSRAI